MVRAPDLKSRGPGFKSRSDHLDLFHGSLVLESKVTLCKEPTGLPPTIWDVLPYVMFNLYIYFNDL